MMMIFRYCNQRLLFEFLFDIWASTFNPYGSLSSTGEKVHKNEKGKLQKAKVKSNKLKITNSKILIPALMAINAKSMASCQASLTFTECQGVWIKILVLGEIWHLPPTTPPTPPGSTCRAIHLLSSSLQVSRSLSSGGDLLPGHKQTNYPSERPNVKSWFSNGRQIEEKLV